MQHTHPWRVRSVESVSAKTGRPCGIVHPGTPWRWHGFDPGRHSEAGHTHFFLPSICVKITFILLSVDVCTSIISKTYYTYLNLKDDLKIIFKKCSLSSEPVGKVVAVDMLSGGWPQAFRFV